MAPGIYSPKTLQVRKEEDFEADSIGRSNERNRAQRGEEEGAPDMRGHGVSDTQGEADASARVSLLGQRRLSPERVGKRLRAREANGPRARGGLPG
jgi:hypothetical protein